MNPLFRKGLRINMPNDKNNTQVVKKLQRLFKNQLASK